MVFENNNIESVNSISTEHLTTNILTATYANFNGIINLGNEVSLNIGTQFITGTEIEQAIHRQIMGSDDLGLIECRVDELEKLLQKQLILIETLQTKVEILEQDLKDRRWQLI